MTEHADETRLTALLDRLDLRQKIRLLTGADMWHTHAEPAIGLRTMLLSDGPSGVRGGGFDERSPSLLLPSPTALGATWDTGLAHRYGAALGLEARRKGVHVLLGPTVNLHRSPLGGRHFESFSEDPALTAALAGAYVAGVQGNGVGATPKHYVGNEAETDRFTVDNRISERALRELYLAAFEDAVTESRAWLVMSAYNSVNGTTMTEHELLRTPLKDEWGFDGVVVSDWFAVRSTEPAALAAQDLVMPGPEGTWGDALVAAAGRGDVPESVIDEKVLRLLRLAERVGALDGSASAEPALAEDGVALAREVAATGMVLLRNEGVLPLAPGSVTSVALSGQNAELARTQGGGSATVLPEHEVSPLEGLRTALAGTARVGYTVGAQISDGLVPLARASMTNPETGEPGVRVRFLAEDGTELGTQDRLAANLIWLGDDIPSGVAEIQLSTRWRVPDGGRELGFAGIGTFRLLVDGRELLADNTSDDSGLLGGALFDPPHRTSTVDLRAGKEVLLELEYTPEGPADAPIRLLAVTLGSRSEIADPDAEIASAADAAADADVAVVVVGTSSTIESEGFDRTSLALPGRQDDLVRAVAKANPRTVVVVNAGAPVLMPWFDDVAAVLLGWFGGQEFGHALADVLLGVREPGGRLPTTWPAAQEDVPVLATTPGDGVLRYTEDLGIGHRAWLESERKPLAPFGFGLGYSTWELAGADVPAAVPAGAAAELTVTAANTGERTGRDVVQVYLSRADSAIERPARWLAGWAVVEAGPGERVETAVRLAPRAFAHWDGDGWAYEPGEFTVHIGRSVTDIAVTAALRIEN